MTHLINELMNDKGVNRTAPATPHLLISNLHIHRAGKSITKKREKKIGL